MESGEPEDEETPWEDADPEDEVVEISDGGDDEDDEGTVFLKASQDVIDGPYATLEEVVAEGNDDSVEHVGSLSQAEWETAMRQYGKSSVEPFTTDEAMEMAYTLSSMKDSAHLYAHWRRGDVVIKSFDKSDGVEFMDRPDS